MNDAWAFFKPILYIDMCAFMLQLSSSSLHETFVSTLLSNDVSNQLEACSKKFGGECNKIV